MMPEPLRRRRCFPCSPFLAPSFPSLFYFLVCRGVAFFFLCFFYVSVILPFVLFTYLRAENARLCFPTGEHDDDIVRVYAPIVFV